MQNIPLQGGAFNAHQQFSVQLGDNLVDFDINYQQSGQWSLDLYQDGVIICAGAMLEPNADVIESWNLEGVIGSLVFTGLEATLENLGNDNTLTWLSPDEL